MLFITQLKTYTSGRYYISFTILNDVSRIVLSDATIWSITYDRN
jgi:hypothetical protein